MERSFHPGFRTDYFAENLLFFQHNSIHWDNEMFIHFNISQPVN